MLTNCIVGVGPLRAGWTWAAGLSVYKTLAPALLLTTSYLALYPNTLGASWAACWISLIDDKQIKSQSIRCG